MTCCSVGSSCAKKGRPGAWRRILARRACITILWTRSTHPRSIRRVSGALARLAQCFLARLHESFRKLGRRADELLRHLERRVDDLLARTTVGTHIGEHAVDGVKELPHRLKRMSSQRLANDSMMRSAAWVSASVVAMDSSISLALDSPSCGYSQCVRLHGIGARGLCHVFSV